jgi:DNA-binding transcriptional MerR regulator
MSFQDWYRKNAQKIAEKRKRLLSESEEAREKSRKQKRDSYHRRKLGIKKGRRTEKPLRGIIKQMNFTWGGRHDYGWCYSVGALAEKLNVERSVLDKLTRDGRMPEAPARTHTGRRFYPEKMLPELAEMIASVNPLPTFQKRRVRLYKLTRPGLKRSFEVLLLTHTNLAEMCGIPRVTLHKWEFKGIFPKTPLITLKKCRLYTYEMADAVRKALSRIWRFSKSPRSERILAARDTIESAWKSLGVYDWQVLRRSKKKVDKSLEINFGVNHGPEF